MLIHERTELRKQVDRLAKELEAAGGQLRLMQDEFDNNRNAEHKKTKCQNIALKNLEQMVSCAVFGAGRVGCRENNRKLTEKQQKIIEKIKKN